MLGVIGVAGVLPMLSPVMSAARFRVVLDVNGVASELFRQSLQSKCWLEGAI